MIQNIFEQISSRVSNGEQVALVSVIKTTGSSPASVGQFIAVFADGSSVGTVGGGASEHRVIQTAVDAIKSGKQIFEFEFDHAENGMVCGGGMSGFGNILGNNNQLYIFGGGHVSQSLAPVAKLTGFSVTIVEDRPELKDYFDENIKYIISNPEDYSKNLNISSPHSYAVICTRGHKGDSASLRYCLSQNFKYIGMIGSSKKVNSVFSGLRQEGFTDEQLENVYTPIGLNIASEAPSEIAVSIMAEILLVKNGGSNQHKALKK